MERRTRIEWHADGTFEPLNAARDANRPTRPHVVVVGQAGRDVVLSVGTVPDPGGSVTVDERIEILGGKGANQAIGLQQLGAKARLVAVVGEDAQGTSMLQQIVDAEVNADSVVRRGTTALLVDVVDNEGANRLIEDVPPESLLTMNDVDAAESRGVFDGADVVCLQLQQPGDVLVRAATHARWRDVRVLLDGAVEGRERDELVSLSQVVRADAHEAELLTGSRVQSVDDASRAAHSLLADGPELVVLAIEDRGEFAAWRGGAVFVPFGDDPVVDPTGGGDAFVAGLVTGLNAGLGPERAVRFASRAAASTIGHLGGRPDLAHLDPHN
ncbi:ribokinase [Okibacterium sp. HSC-33S16]|uniref:PfkB family carbohydrate kinase n=1 Tax=Okibacterium sp. HSC-33S16 TaxID=2910965 RepID=UPI0020A1B90C|nr:PfkB family carbohydrate kinase [Okibacterium sp. HSC-33S16]MCP2032371.1 ribokinase [Okibacterium sp. HSC-33S16]